MGQHDERRRINIQTLVVSLNYDEPFQSNNDSALRTLTRVDSNITYLEDSSVKIGGITFYGSPWTPTFINWYFMAARGSVIREKWAAIPENTDVLVTHGPPATILDNVRGIPRGCVDLLESIKQINPQYNVFGHIHEGYGSTRKNNTVFINACVCDGRYRPVNRPVVFEL